MPYSASSRETSSQIADNIIFKRTSQDGIYGDALFALYKLSLYKHIEQTFGWNDDFQRHRFDTTYRGDEFTVITEGPVMVGYFSTKNEHDAVHVSLLLIQPEFQRKGIGRKAMQTLMARASAANRSVTLSCFICNQPAMDFYERLGFQVVTKEEDFVNYRWQDSANGISF